MLIIGFILYWYDYRYLWGTQVPFNLLMWRTNITPDNALSIVAITAIFFVLSYRFRQFKSNFLFAGLLTIIMTILGIFYYEYFVISLIDINDLEYLCGALAITMVLIRYFTSKLILRQFMKRLISYLVPTIMFPYAAWRFLQIPYGFYYVNNKLIMTPYFNDPITHLFSVMLWVLDGVILILMFSPNIF